MRCSTCREDNPPHAKFCIGCAASFGMAASAPAAFTPSHLASKILAGRQALEGERRRISVLFADIESSTSLVVGRDPEDARVIIDGVLRKMIDAVHQFEGIVNQIMGDGIMALFGAPLAHEDHAVRACFAALRMQGAMQLHTDESVFGLRAPIRIRVGVNSGDVLVRSIAGDLHMEYTAIGQTTYLAAKLEQRARPGEVLVTAEVMRLVEGFVDGRRQECLNLPGLPEPVDVYELASVTSARTRFQVAADRGLNRFVGREFETTQLEGAAELASHGAGQALGIVGEAGVGKTRLLWEFKRRQQERGWNVLASSSIARGAQGPYFPIIELLVDLFHVDPADSAERVGGRIHRRMSDLAGAPAVDLPPLLALLDVQNRDPAWDSLDPAQRRVRTRDALTHLLINEANRRQTVVAIEDLQWADSATIEFLDHLVAKLEDAKLMLLLEYRPEHEHRLDRYARFQTLRVDPLRDPSAATLFRGLVGEDPALASLEALVLGRTEGNPFFLEECVRMLIERGELVGEAGDYHLGRPIDSIEIPATVEDVLAARIARLTEQEREMVQIAAVIGKDIAMPVLRQVAGLGGTDLLAILARLVSADLLSEVGTYPELAYGFKHAFTHEVAYKGVLRLRRKELHARLVEVLESLHAGQFREHIEQLAHHAVCGERWDRAVVYLQIAARRAFDRSAMRETVHHLEEAIRVVAYLPPDLRSAEWAIDLRLALRNPLLALGNVERVIGVLREAEALAAAREDPIRQCRVAVYLCGQYWMDGQHQAAVEMGERALAIAAPLGDLSLLVPTRQYVGGARHAMGEYAAAQEILSTNIAALEGTARNERFGMVGLPAVFARAVRGWLRADLGEFEAAALDAEEALRIAEDVGHGFSIQGACFVLGSLHLARGELPEARAVLEKALAISRVERHRLWVPLLGSPLALALAESGHIDAAASLIDKIVPNPGNPTLTTFTLLAVCDVYLRVGRVQLAALHAERVLERARFKRERGWEADALRLLGEIAEHREPPDIEVADAYYHAALERAEELRMRPLAARCRLRLASTYARSGSSQQAQAELANARAMFVALGTPFWFERACEPDRNLIGTD